MARSTARKRALNTLYEADEKGQDILSLLAERIARPGAQTPLPEYAVTIVRGVADHFATIDRALTEHSTGWNIKRMAVVDRNILRIAAWEIIGNDEVPDKVAIDEALGLAKTLSDDESLSFIHGLLSSLCLDKTSYDFEKDLLQENPAETSSADDAQPTPEADALHPSEGPGETSTDTSTEIQQHSSGDELNEDSGKATVNDPAVGRDEHDAPIAEVPEDTDQTE